MVTRAVEGKGGSEQVAADSARAQPQVEGLPNRRDLTGCNYMEAPRSIDSIFEFQFEDFCPFLVRCVRRVLALAREQEGEMACGLRLRSDDAVVKVEQRPERSKLCTVWHPRDAQDASPHPAMPIQPHHRHAAVGVVGGQHGGPPHRQVGRRTDRRIAAGNQRHAAHDRSRFRRRRALSTGGSRPGACCGWATK
jgi:hypothetical protein